MALRLRRDVQKASYYVWFLGAEEARGLRGERVINSVLPYLIDRSRGQDPLKVTLQVSHKGIKILQGSSKHFIPHSAITSSVQTDDIVACVFLLYNPATKCPLHVHAYRCDSESTAETLHQQLQILINRPENQKRFEELESRLGILPPITSSSNKSNSSYVHNSKEHVVQKSQNSQLHKSDRKHQQRSLELSPKRFSSSLGSDTGNSTRESEGSEEQNGNSPISRSPPTIVKPTALPPVASNELFDSLAAELRAKLNGNGPPILLPPRDYDTVHRSKGNLTAIELRRCRNALIVGSTTKPNGKQVSSRGSSGIGSDLAPSPERQDVNSSSDDEHWSNEADNSVIALKPSQIAVERSAPIIPHHAQRNRNSSMQPEDSYLRDLPAKPYTPRSHGHANVRDYKSNVPRDARSKTPSSNSLSREDEIKPIIMHPSDYDAKFHRVLNHDSHPKLRDTDKYNEINRLLNKKLTIDHDKSVKPVHYNNHMAPESDDYDDSDIPSENYPVRDRHGYARENLTDKQKSLEYNSKMQKKSYVNKEAEKFEGRRRYADPADLPFDEVSSSMMSNKYGGVPASEHSVPLSASQSDLRYRADRRDSVEPDKRRHISRERDPDIERYGRNNERNPYREPESIPYIQSMEKMLKSSALRYKSFDGEPESKSKGHIKNQRTQSYQKHDEDFNDYPRRERGPPEYVPSTGSREDNRYRDSKDKNHPVNVDQHSNSRHKLVEKRSYDEYREKHFESLEPIERPHMYRKEWSDEEHLSGSQLKPDGRSRSRSRDQWEHDMIKMLPPKQAVASNQLYPRREYERDVRPRETSLSKQPDHHPRDKRDYPSEQHYRDQRRYEVRDRDTDKEAHFGERDNRRHVHQRDYSPDSRPNSEYRPEYPVDNRKHNDAAITSAKSLSNLAKGYRHSYAEPVLARGRVGLAAVNPY